MRKIPLFALALAALLLFPCSGLAGGSLNGAWTLTVTLSDGDTIVEPCELRVNDDFLSGTVVHMEDGQGFPQPLEGELGPGGELWFDLYYMYDYSDPIAYDGRIGPDGDTITGTWSVGQVQGPFRMTREGALPQPSSNTGTNLAGMWVFSYESGDGSSQADPCEVQQTGDAFSGTITYYQDGVQYQETFEGTINSDGAVTFNLFAGDDSYPHLGRLSPDGNAISGHWSDPEGGGPFHMLRLP